ECNQIRAREPDHALVHPQMCADALPLVCRGREPRRGSADRHVRHACWAEPGGVALVGLVVARFGRNDRRTGSIFAARWPLNACHLQPVNGYPNRTPSDRTPFSLLSPLLAGKPRDTNPSTGPPDAHLFPT